MAKGGGDREETDNCPGEVGPHEVVLVVLISPPPPLVTVTPLIPLLLVRRTESGEMLMLCR
jgi:hypothetical protein